MRRLLLLGLVLGLTLSGVSADVVKPGGSRSSVVVLCSKTALTNTTTGTVEEVLNTCTFPANTFGATTGYYGFRARQTVDAAANTNSKVVRWRLDGTGGTQLSSESNTTSAQRFVIDLQCYVTAADRVTCVLFRGILSAAPGFTTDITWTFASAHTLDSTGTTSVQAGDLTIRSLTVELLAR